MKNIQTLKFLILSAIFIPIIASAQFPGTDPTGDYYSATFSGGLDSAYSTYNTQILFAEGSNGMTSGSATRLYVYPDGPLTSINYLYAVDDSNRFQTQYMGDIFFWGLIAQDGNTFNMIETAKNDSSFAMGIAFKKSSGKTNADFSGDFYGAEMYVEKIPCKGPCPTGTSGSFLELSADGAGNLSVYIEHNDGALDTLFATYTLSADGYYEVTDKASQSLVFKGVLSPDGDSFFQVPMNGRIGLLYGIKKSVGMAMTDLPEKFNYHDMTFSNDDGEFMEVVENDIRLYQDSTGFAGQLSKSRDNELDSTALRWTVDGSGFLEVWAGDFYMGRGAINPSMNKFFLVGLNQDRVSLGLGIGRPYSPDAIGEDQTLKERSFQLEANYPNPFNPTTTINYKIDKPGQIELIIYNTLGQKVKTLVAKTLSTGLHRVIWDGLDNNNHAVSSGVYFYQLKTESGAITKKMTLIR